MATGVSGNDWLLLRLPDGANVAGIATPLRLRREPVKVGENVHLVGVSYDEPSVVQKVYSGKVTAREYSDYFRFDISPAVAIAGFSGAPVLDDAGRVVGVTSIVFDPKSKGGLETESGAQDAASAFRIMRGKP